MTNPISERLKPKLPVVAADYAEHVNPAFVRLLGMLGYGRVFTRAVGTRLWDAEGRTYTDFLAGFGTSCLGHAPRLIQDALASAITEELPNVLHVGPQSAAAELGKAFAERVPHLPMCLPSLSGGEAVEAAMKLARAATGRPAIVYANGGFHGTGLGGLSVMGHARWKKPFQPLLPECIAVPFGDVDALRWALENHKVAGFLVEPIQAEAGVVLPPPGYLLEAQRLCRGAGALFMLDEVQTGLARTGKLFAYQHEDGVEPDVLILGKGLGAGVLPVSVTLTRRAIQEAAYGKMWNFDLHGSTYSGYALGCRVACAVLGAVSETSFVDKVRATGERLVRLLGARLGSHAFVKDIRGKGLMVAIEIGPTGARILDRIAPRITETVAKQMFGQWVAVRLLERGYVCQPASQSWNVLKLTPPLTIADDDVDGFVDSLAAVLGEYDGLAPIIADVSRRFSKQMLAGGPFG